MYNLYWARKELTRQKLGSFCEYYAKMTLASYGMDIYSSEVDDHGIDFVAEYKKGFLKFQVKAIRLASTSYVFMKERYFDVNDESLYLYLFLLKDNEHPIDFIIPASAWKEGSGSKLFVHRTNYSEPEYGVNISQKNMSELEKYKSDIMIANYLK